MLTATTVISAPVRSAVTEASVNAAPSPLRSVQIGSWPGASPNHTTIRLLSVRQPIDGFVASWCRAKNWPSGRSSPSPSRAVHVSIAAVTGTWLVVGDSWCWKA